MACSLMDTSDGSDAAVGDGVVDSLCRTCVRYLAGNLQVFCAYDYSSGWWRLQPGVYLPTQVAEDLIAILQELKAEMSEGVLHIFADTAAAPLRRVKLDTSETTDLGLAWILQHDLIELDLIWGYSLTERSWLSIQEHGANLKRLAIHNADGLLKYDLISGLEENPGFAIFAAGDISAVDPSVKDLVTTKLKQTCEDGAVPVRLVSPRLRSLTIQSLSLIRHKTAELLEHLCRPLVTLTYLDLSHCPVLVDSLVWLSELSHLIVLILHSVPIRNLQIAFNNISKLKSLRKLDISTSHRNSHMFPYGDVYLRRLVGTLPVLSALDLSGTNIAVPYDHTDMQHPDNVCGIKGMERCHLEFLGLLGCPGFEEPPYNVPARMAAGAWGVEPLLCAGTVYEERKSMITMLLPSLLMSLRSMEYSDEQNRRALKIVLGALQNYMNSFSIAHYSILSLAILLHKGLVKGCWIGPQTKRLIIFTLLDLMECQWQKTHFNKAELMRKCCATLSYFDLANDLLFVYERVLEMMTSLISTNSGALSHQPLVQTALYILRHMSSQVDVSYKELAGRHGCIKKMLKVINCSVSPDREGDTVLLRAWSVLWSLTDMSPANCERFLKEDGLMTFMECYHCLPTDTALINKMVGMLRNVVEVPHLRPELVSDEYIRIFSCMLESEPNISNSSCSILAHLLADGPHAWMSDMPVDGLIHRMEEAISCWDLSTRRNVRYRSFEPMLQLLRCYSPIVSMHWASWEVANMMLKNADRYCPMLEKEGGIALVMELLQDPRPPPNIKTLGETIITRWRHWQATSPEAR